MDLNDIKPVRFSGDDEWFGSYELGRALEGAFPGQDASDFANAVHHNSLSNILTLIAEDGVQDLKCTRFGERDESSWTWRITFGSGRVFQVDGGCDYTGWDCQSWATAEEVM